MPEWSREIRERLARLSVAPEREASVVEEIAQHLEDRYSELVARGASPEAARTAVLEELDRPDLAASLAGELPRPTSPRTPTADDGGGFLAGLGRDLRYGARRLRLEPGFALVATLSLALGVGANTAIFQLLDAVRLRTLPVAQPERLWNVRILPTKDGRSGGFSGRWPQLTSAIWERLRDEQKAFSKLAVWSSDRVDLASGGESRYAEALFVSGTFFDTVGVGARRGRVLGPADDTPGCSSAAVMLSERFWRREFGGRDLLPGETIRIEGHAFEIAGVTPARFFGIDVGRAFDVVLPVCAESLITEMPRTRSRRDWWLSAVGRLAPGWTPERADAHLAAISPGIFEASLPESFDARRAKNFLSFRLKAWPVSTGFSDLREEYDDPLRLVLGVSVLVLLIACANIANLMLARASARQREIAVRLALGASPRLVVRQLLAESLVLAGAGALAGAALAQVLGRLLVAFLSTQAAQWFVDMPLDVRLLAFTIGIAGLTCALFGLLPALQASRTDPIEALKSGGRGVAGAGARLGLRRALVVTQVALSLVLLTGALFFVRSLRNLLTLDAGFSRDRVLAVTLDYTRLRLPAERHAEFRRALLERVRAIPGVAAAAGARLVPLGGDGWNEDVSVDGGAAKHQTADFNAIGPGYFGAMGTALLAGRDFDAHDGPGSERVAIVTKTFVRKFLGSGNPVGREFHTDEPGDPNWRQFRIVGVVRDTKYEEMREDFQPIVFIPQDQDERHRPVSSIVVRSDLPLATLRPPLTAAVAAVSPEIGITFRPMPEIVSDGLLRERLVASLSGFFGFLAALLAMIGLYGIVSYTVVRRRNEIGVRMAMGATRRDILALVLREAGMLLAAGLPIGVVLAIGAATLARSLLFGMKPFDPATLAAAAFGLAAVAIAASLLPARRAAALDPVTALREE